MICLLNANSIKKQIMKEASIEEIKNAGLDFCSTARFKELYNYYKKNLPMPR